MNSINLSGRIEKITKPNKQSLGLSIDVGTLSLPEIGIKDYKNVVFAMIDLMEASSGKICNIDQIEIGDYVAINSAKFKSVAIESSSSAGFIVEKSIIRANFSNLKSSKSKFMKTNLCQFSVRLHSLINDKAVLVGIDNQVKSVTVIMKNNPELIVNRDYHIIGDVLLLPEGYDKFTTLGKHGFYAEMMLSTPEHDTTVVDNSAQVI